MIVIVPWILFFWAGYQYGRLAELKCSQSRFDRLADVAEEWKRRYEELVDESDWWKR